MLYIVLSVFLLANLLAGMWRILRGPEAPDRMLAAQLFSTTSGAALLLMAAATNLNALRDIALVLALLAAVTAVAFVRITWQSDGADR